MRGAFLDKVCAWNLNYQTNVRLIIRLPSNFQHYTPMATNLIQFVFVFSSRPFDGGVIEPRFQSSHSQEVDLGSGTLGKRRK